MCDLQRSKVKLIPNELFDLLDQHQNNTINELLHKYPGYEENINEYINFLIENEWGFLCDEPELFPDMDLTWDSPERITNSIIDIDQTSNYDLFNVISQLEKVKCKYIQIRSYDSLSGQQIESLVINIKHNTLKSLELIVRYEDAITKDFIFSLVKRYNFLTKIIVYSSPDNVIIKNDETNQDLIYYVQSIIDRNSCGIIDTCYFTSNIPFFTESIKYNNCLNRKISFDTEGNIKNCPSMKESYGNIIDTSIDSIINNEKFKEKWFIKKDDIEVCKDCEYRYICSDCRVYVKEKGNLYSQPKKCSYDPYSAKWL